jgi:hypothetical protein
VTLAPHQELHSFALLLIIKGEECSDPTSNLVLDGSLDMTNDFRSLYATVLANYLQVDPQPILDSTDQYPDFPTLGFI